MPTLLDYRRRIRSVKNTQQITRAMKFVAAARLRRAQEKVIAARPYARAMAGVLRSALARAEGPTHPLMARRPEQRLMLLALSGDRGLCGAFNTNVIRRSAEFRREHSGQALEVIAIGKKGRDALKKQSWRLAAEYINVTTRVEFSRAKQIASQVIARYEAEEVDAVYMLYNEFKSILAQKMILEKLLPIEAGMLESRTPGRHQDPQPTSQVDYIYEQPATEIFGRLLPRYVETQVFRAMLESSAAEHAARMTAMDAATNNAAELIDQLTLHMNKVRQAAITKEIIEVVSGTQAEA